MSANRHAAAAALSVVFLAALLAAAPAAAQSHPGKPVRNIVPFPAGGPLDVGARLFSPALGERMGTAFIVENRPGASGNIGMEAAMRAAPDGYTVLWAIDSMLTVNPLMYANLPDPLTELQPVGLVAESVPTLAVYPGLGVKDAASFVKLSQSRDLSYGSAGAGSPGHRMMEYYKLATGAKLTHVPFKGNAPAVQNLVAGRIHAFITPVAGVLGHVRAGRLQSLMVTSATRHPALPDVPTMIELGYPKFSVVAWFSVLVPAKTPQAVLARLEREFAEVARLPQVREGLQRAGLEPRWAAGPEVAQRTRAERAIWREVIERTGMKIE